MLIDASLVNDIFGNVLAAADEETFVYGFSRCMERRFGSKLEQDAI